MILTYFTELQTQLKEVKAEVKADIADIAKERVTTDYLSSEMNKQAAQIKSDMMTSQSEVVRQLQSEVTALRDQTEIVV